MIETLPNLIAVGYPRKRTARTAGVEAVRLHCRGDFPHRPCEVVRAELRSYRGKPNYWSVELAVR